MYVSGYCTVSYARGHTMIKTRVFLTHLHLTPQALAHAALSNQLQISQDQNLTFECVYQPI